MMKEAKQPGERKNVNNSGSRKKAESLTAHKQAQKPAASHRIEGGYVLVLQ